jgi:N-succinyldiaminopimelate aminotransferase
VGDEVVVFEPAYDSYLAVLAMAGAVARVVTLRPPRFDYDPAALEAAIGPKTRAILVNTPHNPTGKVFAPAELEHVARLAREHDLLAITDEVYEHIVFDGRHRPLAALPGMRERTIAISSTGKTFSLTGWKIGWNAGLAPLVPAGTYFVLADVRPLGYDDGLAFCRMLPERAGVAAIPVSAFCLNKEPARHLVRFAFCKTDAVLDEGLRRLRRLR